MLAFFAHFFVAYHVLVNPWLGRARYLKLKRDIAAGVPNAKISAYKRSLAGQFLRVVLVLAFARADPDFAGLFRLVRPGYESSADFFLLFFTITILLSAIWFRYRGNWQFQQLRQSAGTILPWTSAECRWFAAIGVGAGISEELVFRGFLYFYFRKFVPGLGPQEALAISALIFGFNHLYQGYKGVLGTSLVGALLGILYYQFGGLLVPMVVHSLIDLRIMLILTPQRLRTLQDGATPN